jgi:hypothetical protein
MQQIVSYQDLTGRRIVLWILKEIVILVAIMLSVPQNPAMLPVVLLGLDMMIVVYHLISVFVFHLLRARMAVILTKGGVCLSQLLLVV